MVLDVGAAEGFFTSKALQSGAKVIAIECNPLFAKPYLKRLSRIYLQDN